MTDETDVLSVIACALLLIAAFLLIIRLVLFAEEFRHKLKIIKMEINRNTGDERLHWQHEKRRLWLSLLPFHRR
ncbi:MAG: hypothetical protein ACI4F7_00035 [Acutalibacteraceae bacterium]